jgi:glycogen operon protein
LRKRNLLATLMLSQGVPMLLAGDELGHSQGGNNNAYAQDNETTWIDWVRPDQGLMDFVARLTRLRAAHPVLRQRQFLHGRLRPHDQRADVIWRRADGQSPEPGQWHDPAFRCLGVELRMSALRGPNPDIVYVVFNTGQEQSLILPDSAGSWRKILDTTQPEAADVVVQSGLRLPANAVLVFIPEPAGGLK